MRIFLSDVVSSSIVRFEERLIFTTPLGIILLILNSIEFPNIITEISSPADNGNPFNLFLTKSVNSLSTVTTSFIGTRTTVFAVFVSTFLT